jgi:flavin-dependent dehydrogenase
MNERVFDVAIIGGGIAGCAAAIQLARHNRRVILCEAKSYPHHKVCGEFLSPECAAMLDALGLSSAIQAVRPAAISSAAITAPDGTTWETELTGTAIGISRYTLDHLMAAQARTCGVEVRDLTTISRVQGSLETTFSLDIRGTVQPENIQARTVIGAHGKRSTLDRTLNRPFLKKPQPFVALKCHFYGPPLPGRIHLFAFPGGYCGMSEIEKGQVNACLLVRQEVFQAAGAGHISHFIDWMQAQNPALGIWLSAAKPVYESWISIAQVSFDDKQIIVDDILMVGDSAGLIAPIAGDGMGMALQASFMASTLLNQYLSEQISAVTLRQQYVAEWRRAFRLRLRLSRMLQAILLRPGWLTPGLRLINASPTLGHFLVTHTRDSHLIQT